MLKIYDNDIINTNGKEKLGKRYALSGKFTSVEDAEKKIEESFEDMCRNKEKYPSMFIIGTVGVKFSVTDLETKTVIKTFEKRF